MPVACREGGTVLVGPDLDPEQWSQLKADTRRGRRQLTTTCCGVRAIPKTSKFGFQFFAHYQGAKACPHGGGEGIEHLQTKLRVYRAALAAGWEAGIEVSGASPEGKRWLADVYAQRGKRRIAFEVQLSPQDQGALAERQNVYASSGVRAAWLYGPKAWKRLRHGYQASQDVPLVTLEEDLQTVSVPLTPAWLEEPPRMPVQEFVSGALSGWLRWYDAQRQPYQPSCLEAFRRPCYRCKAWIETAKSLRLPYSAWVYDMIELRHDHPLFEAIDRLRDRYKSLTPVQLKWSQTRKEKYPVALCPECGAKQGNHFLPSRRSGHYRILYPVDIPADIGEEGRFWRWQRPQTSFPTWFELFAPQEAEWRGRTEIRWR